MDGISEVREADRMEDDCMLARDATSVQSDDPETGLVSDAHFQYWASYFRHNVPSLRHVHHVGPSRRVRAEQFVPLSWIYGTPEWRALLHMTVSKCICLADVQTMPRQHVEIELRMGCYDAQTKRGVYVAADEEAQRNQNHDMEEHRRWSRDKSMATEGAIQSSMQAPAATGKQRQGAASSSSSSAATASDALVGSSEAVMADIRPMIAISIPRSSLYAFGSPATAPASSAPVHLSEARFTQLLARMESLHAVGFLFENVVSKKWKPIRTTNVSFTELHYKSLPTLETPHTRFRKVMHGNKPGPSSTKQSLWACAIAGPRFAYALPWPSRDGLTHSPDTDFAVRTHAFHSAATSSSVSSSKPVQWPLLDAKLCVSLEEHFPLESADSVGSKKEATLLPVNYIEPLCTRVVKKSRRIFLVGCVEIAFTTFEEGGGGFTFPSYSPSPSPSLSPSPSPTAVDYQIEFELKLPRVWKDRSDPVKWGFAIQELYLWYLFLNHAELP
jgi:hypothetical protein